MHVPRLTRAVSVTLQNFPQRQMHITLSRPVLIALKLLEFLYELRLEFCIF
jgi:hypothetical protein